MTIVISDLVARVSALGVQETAAQVKAVGAEAATTARALELMAAQFAKLHGGTAADALSMFQRSGVQPTAAALDQAAKAAEKTAAAVASAVAPTQSAAKAAAEMHEGFKLSESSAIRFVAGIAGIGLGISLVAGAARMVHGAISDIVTSQLDWERSLKNLSGLYGETGTRAAALANAQANLPGVLGDQREFAQAGINASDLRLRYGLPQQLIDRLTTTGGRVAFATGMTNEADRVQLQEQIAQAVRTGAPLPARYGVFNDEETVARRLGFNAPQALQAYTPQQLQEARGAIVSEGMNTFADRAAANRRAALDAAVAAEKAVEQARTGLQGSLERGMPLPSTTSQPGSAFLAGGPLSTISGLREPTTGYRGPGGAAEWGNVEAANQQLAKAVSAEAAALADSTKAQEESRRTFDLLARGAEQAGARLLNFAGALTDTTSIAHGDILAQAQGAVTARARGANPLRAMTDAEIAAQARGGAWQDVYRQYVAPLAQQEQSNAIQGFLQRQAAMQGPGLESSRAAAQAALAEAPRRNAAQQVIGQADRAGDFASRAATEAGAQISAINLQQEQRHLAVAQDVATLRSRALDLEGQLAPFVMKRAFYEELMALAMRDSLTSRLALIKAEKETTATGAPLADLDYEQRRLELRAEVSRAAARRGEAPTEDISALRQEYRGLELQRPPLELADLDAQHRRDLVQRQRTQENLARQETAVPIEAQLRSVQDQTIPLTQKLRLVQEEEASIQRSIALRDLADTKALTAAQLQLNQSTALRLVTDQIARQAQDYAAGLNLGATAAERSAAALAAGYKSLNDTAVALAGMRSMQDIDAKIASGLGAGGIGPTGGSTSRTSGGVTFAPVFQITGATKDEMRQQLVDAFDGFFSGLSTGGLPAPSTVGGAGR